MRDCPLISGKSTRRVITKWGHAGAGIDIDTWECMTCKETKYRRKAMVFEREIRPGVRISAEGMGYECGCCGDVITHAKDPDIVRKMFDTTYEYTKTVIEKRDARARHRKSSK